MPTNIRVSDSIPKEVESGLDSLVDDLDTAFQAKNERIEELEEEVKSLTKERDELQGRVNELEG